MTIEFLWPAALVAGFFGSTHCIGMCGAIVILFEQSGGDTKTSSQFLSTLAETIKKMPSYVPPLYREMFEKSSVF